MANETYDLEQAFMRFEEDLIQDLINTIQNNTTGDILAKGDFNHWKKSQLKALHDFKSRNKQHFTKKSKRHLNKMIEEALKKSYKAGGVYTKGEIEKAIKKGLRTKETPSDNMTAGFTGVNDRKLNALMSETKSCLYKAEHSAFRYTEDIYRKVIFDAQTYFNTGTGTLAQSIDMATKDFLSRGVDCIEYKDGRRVNIQSYSEMVLRTSNKRSYMQGEAAMREQYGLNLVIVTRRGNACPKCMNFVGKVFIDDVYGSGKPDGKHQLLSTAIAGGLYHPNCRDTHTTYFEGITTKRPEPTAAEKAEAERIYNLEQKQRYNERQIRKYDRLAKGSIDPDNKTKYENLKNEWQKKNRDFINEHDELKRKYYREKNIGVKDQPIKKPTPVAAEKPKTTPKTEVKKVPDTKPMPKPEVKPVPKTIVKPEPKTETTPKETTVEKTSTPKKKTSTTTKTTSSKPKTPVNKDVTVATNREEAYQVLKNNNIKYKKRGLDNMNDKDFINTANRMAELKNKYGVDVTLSARSEKNSNAAAKTMFFKDKLKNTEIQMNSSVKDLKKTASKNITKGWWSRTTPEMAKYQTATHEYGHAVELSIIDDRFKKRGIAAGDVTNEMLNNEFRTIKNEITTMFKEKYPDESYIQYVSGYGRTSSEEFFAEAFAGANGGMPNKLELCIDEWIKKEGYLQ